MAPGQVIDAHRSCIAPCISNRDTCVPRQRSMQVRDDDDSGRSRRRRCTRLRQFPSKCRRMCSCVRRRHCRNYSLRPPGPSERCLASTPYLEPAELSPPLRPISLSFSLLLSLSLLLSHSVTLFPPFPAPFLSSVFSVGHVRTHVLFALPRETRLKPSQPTRSTTRPPTLPNPSPFPAGIHNLALSLSLSLYADLFFPVGCRDAGVQSSRRL